MKFIEKTVEKLLNTLYEDFTAYCVTALSMAESDENFNKQDLKKITWLVNNVNEDLQTSIFKLDRFVDPNKVSDNPTKFSYPVTVNSDNIKDPVDDSKQQIKLKSEDLQKHLCNCVLEINTLVYRHLNAYNEDFIMPKAEEHTSEKFE